MSQVPLPPAELAKQADLRITEQYSIKSWIGSAVSIRKKADYDRLSNNIEGAYIGYLKFCTIIIGLPKHRDWPSFTQRSDPIKYSEYMQLKQEVNECLTTIEGIKAELQRRFSEYLTQKAALGIVNKDRSPSSPTALPPVERSLAGMRIGSDSSNSLKISASTESSTLATATTAATATASGNLIPTSPPSDSITAYALRRTMSTPAHIDARKLYSYFEGPSPPRILFVDLRSHQEFCRSHIGGANTVNIDPSLLSKDGMIGSEIEQALPANFHRRNFSNRHEFDILIYFDECSTNIAQNPVLERFVQAVKDFELVKTLSRNPALLVGGWNAWRAAVAASAIKSTKRMIAAGDCDGLLSDDNDNDDLLNGESVAPRRTSGISAALAKPPLSKTDSVYDNPFHNFASAHIISDSPGLYQLPGNDESTTISLYPDRPTTAGGSAGLVSTITALPVGADKPLPIPPPHILPMRGTPPPATLPTAPPLSHQTHPQQSATAALASVARPVISAAPPKPQRAPSPPSPGTIVIHNSTFQQLSLGGAWLSGPIMGRGLIGLKNLGNTCYMNSMIQCLIATRPLAHVFYDGSYRRMLNRDNPMSSKGQLAQSFATLLTQVFREDNGVVVSPSIFKEAVCRYSPQFRGSEQHDSQEWLAMLLDGLHEDLNQGIGVRGGQGMELKVMPDWAKPRISSGQAKDDGGDNDEEEQDERMPEMMAGQRAWLRYLYRNDSIVVQLFQGQLKSQLVCGHCGKTSTTYNPFMYLSLPIPGNAGSAVRISDCLKEFFKDERLDGGDAWRCPRCKVARPAVKRLSISKLPKILLIHLKRFSQNGPFRDKINTHVDFPVNDLDLFPYLTQSAQQLLVAYYQRGKRNGADTQTLLPALANLPSQPPQKFDLYAISNHYGNMNGGHYTAFVRQTGLRKWFQFDDSRVTELCEMGNQQAEQSTIKTRYAYSLFYVSWAALS